MTPITIDTLKQGGWIVFEAIVGSKAYGLDTASSDTDIRGVYIVPQDVYYGLEYPEQVSNETNDVVYYELRRYVELLLRNNPNILELLHLPPHCILHRHPLMDAFIPELFLSKLCEATFANYAFTQIKKAYGLEKKIMTPMEEERKGVAHFCHVWQEGRSVPVTEFASAKGLQLEGMGLSVIAHMRDCYNLFYSESGDYSGLVRSEDSNEVALSSIPKGAQPLAMLHFNRDGYSQYCKKYKAYWEWVARRNAARYQTTVSHGKRYDSKNMMHVFRLLRMAEEIALGKSLHVHRPDREELLAIKAGEYEYDELVEKATAMKDALPALYAASHLPEKPDDDRIVVLMAQVRTDWYKR